MVYKAIWLSELFDDYHVTSAKGSLMNNFFETDSFHIKLCKMYTVLKRKLECKIKLLFDNRLAHFDQLYSQISVGFLQCFIDKAINFQRHMTVCIIARTLRDVFFKDILSNWTNFQIKMRKMYRVLELKLG